MFNTTANRAGLARDLLRICRPGEYFGVVRYALLLLLRSLPGLRKLVPHETWLRLQRTDFLIGIGTAELGAYREIWIDRVYEQNPDFTAQSGWIVVDAGANIGFFSLRCASRKSTVFAFEPNLATFRRLQSAVAKNRALGLVKACCSALGANEGTGWLDGSPQSSVSLVVRPEASATSIPIKIRTLDQIVREVGIKKIDLLKIDVEGGEAEVLRGAAATLRNCPRVVMEYHSPSLLREAQEILAGYGFKQVLAEKGYAFFRLPELPTANLSTDP